MASENQPPRSESMPYSNHSNQTAGIAAANRAQPRTLSCRETTRLGRQVCHRAVCSAKIPIVSSATVRQLPRALKIATSSRRCSSSLTNCPLMEEMQINYRHRHRGWGFTFRPTAQIKTRFPRRSKQRHRSIRAKGKTRGISWRLRTTA